MTKAEQIDLLEEDPSITQAALDVGETALLLTDGVSIAENTHGSKSLDHDDGPYGFVKKDDEAPPKPSRLTPLE